MAVAQRFTITTIRGQASGRRTAYGAWGTAAGPASQANATSDPRGCHSRWLILSLVQTFAAPLALPARGPGSRSRPSDRAGPVRRDRRLPLEPEAPGVCRSITTGTTHSHAWAGPHDGAGRARRWITDRRPHYEGAARRGRVDTVLVAPERQRLGQARRASGQARRASGQIPVADAISTRTGQLEPVDHFPGPHEHPVGDAYRTADQVRAPMHPIREVDVQSPRLAEHHPGARGGPSEVMRPGVVRPAIRLHLGETDRDTRVRDSAPQKLGCHLQNWPGKEGARQSALRHIALPRHTYAPRVPSGTRSSLAMKALSAISMGSEQTSVQHAVMWSKPILALVQQMNDRGPAKVPLRSSWSRITPYALAQKALNALTELLVIKGGSPALPPRLPPVGPARTEGHSSG